MPRSELPAAGLAAAIALAALLGACSKPGELDAPSAAARPSWSLALHGGAGAIPRTLPAAEREQMLSALETALAEGAEALEGGASALDVVERAVTRLEDEPLFNAGRGAVLDAEGRVALDAAIVDGATRACGAVAGVSTVRHPITLARRVMERSAHVLLAGPGAERFALEQGLETVPEEWFVTPARRLEQERVHAGGATRESGTVGAVALDRRGRLAAASSTGGIAGARRGRVGAVPVVGAGILADERVAVVCTGIGESHLRHGTAREISALVRLGGRAVGEAAREVLDRRLSGAEGGLVVLGSEGELALEFRSWAMPRAAADSTGRRRVAIWSDDPE